MMARFVPYNNQSLLYKTVLWRDLFITMFLYCAAYGEDWTQFKFDSGHSGDAADRSVRTPLGLLGGSTIDRRNIYGAGRIRWAGVHRGWIGGGVLRQRGNDGIDLEI